MISGILLVKVINQLLKGEQKMAEQKLENNIEECTDKIAVMRELFRQMRNTHPDPSLCMGLEKICDKILEY